MEYETFKLISNIFTKLNIINKCNKFMHITTYITGYV